MNKKITPKEVFSLMCNTDVFVMNFIKVISIPTIAEHFKTSKYRIRKSMEELRKQGLVKSTTVCDVGEYENIIVKGFKITEKGKQTETYKKADAIELKLISEMLEEER